MYLVLRLPPIILQRRETGGQRKKEEKKYAEMLHQEAYLSAMDANPLPDAVVLPGVGNA
jgi:hypothetical protein